MPFERQGPSDDDLRKYLEKGFTHQQIADDWNQTTGSDVKKSAISQSIRRAGFAKTNARYAETVPWTVKTEHSMEYPVQMLRALGRRLNGDELPADLEQRLTNWYEDMQSTGSLVAYAPFLERGFYYVDGPWPEDGVPIVDEPISENFDLSSFKELGS